MAAGDDLPTGTVFGTGVAPGATAPPQQDLPVGTTFGAGVTPPPPPSWWDTHVQTPEGGWGSYLGHRFGLGVRDVATGLGVPPMVSNWIGLPNPQTNAEAIQSGLQTGAAGVIPGLAFGNIAPTVSAAGPVTQGVARIMAQQPVRQAIVGGAAGASAPVAAATGAPKWVQAGAPYATALASGAVPGATGGLASDMDQALIDLARNKYNIPIYPGQAGSPLTRYLFSVTGKFPGTGATAAYRDQQDAVNAAVGNTFGAVTEGGKLTPDAMTAARANNSGAWGRIAKNTTVNYSTDPLEADLQAVETQLQAHNAADAAPVQKQIDAIREQADRNSNLLSGGWLQKQLDAKSTISTGAGGSTVVKPQWQGLQEALQGAVERNSSLADYQALQIAKGNWKNMRTVEPLVAKGGGDVSLPQLAQTVATNRFQRAAYTGGGDLGELGQIGRIVKPPPESGTAERNLVIGAAGSVPTAVGLAATGHLGAAGATIAPVAAPWLGAIAANRALRVNPMGSTAPNFGPYYARALANPAYVQGQDEIPTITVRPSQQ